MEIKKQTTKLMRSKIFFLVVVIIIAVGSFLAGKWSQDRSNRSDYISEINNLELKIELIEQERDSIQELYATQELISKSFVNKIREQDELIGSLKEKRYEKANHVRALDADSSVLLFSELLFAEDTTSGN